MTNQRYFLRTISMLDFQLFASELGMHNPEPERCSAPTSDEVWIRDHQTYLFPVMEKSPICFRFIAQAFAQVKQIPHHDIWLVWSRAPRLWHDSAKLAYGEPEDEHMLLNAWGTYAINHRALMRTTEQVREVWPIWIKEQEWFAGKKDPTCLT